MGDACCSIFRQIPDDAKVSESEGEYEVDGARPGHPPLVPKAKRSAERNWAQLTETTHSSSDDWMPDWPRSCKPVKLTSDEQHQSDDVHVKIELVSVGHQMCTQGGDCRGFISICLVLSLQSCEQRGWRHLLPWLCSTHHRECLFSLYRLCAV